mmetsp:Transcript_23555/g.58196  ORF Transcript_23555/g.58196 Transcript_23555/m.58196 type:complete len:233 (+) Transcript_23555:1486-2184(+)
MLVYVPGSQSSGRLQTHSDRHRLCVYATHPPAPSTHPDRGQKHRPLRPYTHDRSPPPPTHKAGRQAHTSVCLSVYLTVIFAPASSSFFLASSALSFGTPSKKALGSPSTNSLACLRFNSGFSCLNTLITPILFSTASRMTSNSVCSATSSASAAPPAAPGIIMAPIGIAAAADASTPKASSICLTSSEASKSVSPFSSSTIASVLVDMCSEVGGLRASRVRLSEGRVAWEGE